MEQQTGGRRDLLALVVLIGGIAGSLGRASRGADENRLVEAVRFQQLVSVHRTAVQAEFGRSIDAVTALGGLFEASRSVDEREFGTFSRELLERQPELRALEWLPRVAPGELPNHVAAVRASGHSDYRVRQLSASGELVDAPADAAAWPVRYVFPLEPNRAALGFDVGSEWRRRAALEASIERRRPTATTPVALLQTPGDELDGVLVFRPVFRGGIEQTQVVGVVLAVVDLGGVLATIDPAVRSTELDAWLTWEGDGEESLALRATGSAEAPPSMDQPLTALATIELPGLELDLQYAPSPSFEGSRNATRPWWVGLAGVLISLLVAIGLKNRGDHAVRLGTLARQVGDANLRLEEEAVERERAEADVRRLNAELQQRVEQRTREVRTKTTELGEAQRQLDEQAALAAMLRKERLESLGLLAGGVAHDFNNLLTAILGQASLLQERAGPVVTPSEAGEQIELAAQRAAELVRQLLAYAGRAEGLIEAVQIPAVVAEISRLVAASVSKKATLELHLDHDLPAVEVDSTQLRQVLMNLITNASDALEGAPGKIVVRATISELDETSPRGVWPLGPPTPGPWVSVSVQDEGRGMEPTTVERMFEPFFTTKDAGHGLGLAAVLGVVRAAEGRIRVDSGRDRGTTVELLLPIADVGEVTAPMARPELTPALAGTRVLLVDDEAPVRTLVQAALSSAGCEVTEAADGVEAMNHFEAGPDDYDIVLLDMVMPRMDGPETLAALRALRAELVVILSTGFSATSVEELLDDHTLFLAKPYRARDLLRLVGQATDGG